MPLLLYNESVCFFRAKAGKTRLYAVCWLSERENGSSHAPHLYRDPLSQGTDELRPRLCETRFRNQQVDDRQMRLNL